MEKVQTEPDRPHPAQASDTTLEASDNAVDTAEKHGDANAETPANDALTKMPSQAEQLGKSRIIIVMSALCVCIGSQILTTAN